MKAKALLAAATALTLTACVSAVAWKSVIVGTVMDLKKDDVALPVATDGANNVYQLFPVVSQLYLRKLDPKGVEMWRVNVDESIADTISFSAPLLRITPMGAAVGYHDSTNQQALLKQYDGNGAVLWSTDFGSHATERLQDIAVGDDGSLTTAVRITLTRAAIQRYDSSGLAAPEKIVQRTGGFAVCGFGCVATVAVNTNGETLVNLADITATSSFLLDATGTQLWSKVKSTTDNLLLGASHNRVTATASGFVSVHPIVTWHYDLNGTETWSVPYGSNSKPAVDASGNVYVLDTSDLLLTLNPRVYKLAGDGTVLWEIALTGQLTGKEMEWSEELQRLVVLTYYYDPGLEINGAITEEWGEALTVFDTAGKKLSVLKGVPTKRRSVTITELCPPEEEEPTDSEEPTEPTDPPSCTRLETTLTRGEVLDHFSISLNKRVVASGTIEDTEHFAKAFKLN
ncbi:MAG: hypothetical protein ACOY7J_03440 [Pseudomonadota bacterium]